MPDVECEWIVFFSLHITVSSHLKSFKTLHSPSPVLNSAAVRNPLLSLSRLSNTVSSCSGDSGNSPCNLWQQEDGKLKTLQSAWILLFYHISCSPAYPALWWTLSPLCHTVQTAPSPCPWSLSAGFLAQILWSWVKTVDYVPGPAWGSQLISPAVWGSLVPPHRCLEPPALHHHSATSTWLHRRRWVRS